MLVNHHDIVVIQQPQVFLAALNGLCAALLTPSQVEKLRKSLVAQSCSSSLMTVDALAQTHQLDTVSVGLQVSRPTQGRRRGST
jgi:hypothetical protein